MFSSGHKLPLNDDAACTRYLATIGSLVTFYKLALHFNQKCFRGDICNTAT